MYENKEFVYQVGKKSLSFYQDVRGQKNIKNSVLIHKKQGYN